MIRITTDKKIQEEISKAIQRQWEKDAQDRTIRELNQRIWKLEKAIERNNLAEERTACVCAVE